MYFQLTAFSGSFMSAVIALSMIFVTSGKPPMWVWSMFFSVAGMVTASFGFLLPEIIPYPDLIFVFSTLLMMVGVTSSYYLENNVVSMTAMGLLNQEGKQKGLRLVMAGFIAMTLIVSLVFSSVKFGSQNTNSILSTLYRIERLQLSLTIKQDITAHEVRDLKSEQARLRKETRMRDSTFQAQSKQRGLTVIENQQEIQKQITRQRRFFQQRNRIPTPNAPVFQPLQLRVPDQKLDTSRVKKVAPPKQKKRSFWDMFSLAEFDTLNYN